MRTYKLLISSLALMFFFSPMAQAVKSKDPRITPIGFELLDNRIFVDVEINGKGPFKFIFDTGGNNSMTYELAEQLKLPVHAVGMGSGAGNASQEMGRTKVRSLRIGSISLKDQDFLVLDDSKIRKAFAFKALDGVFGYELLKQYFALIDYELRTLTFLPNESSFASKGYEQIRFEILFDKPFIASKINGITARTLIDTGDRSALTVTKAFRKDKAIGLPFEGQSEVITGVGIGGPILAQVARLTKVELTETTTLTEVVARGPTGEGGFNSMKELDVSIGNEVLKQFHVGLDYRRKILYLKKNKNFGLPTKFTEVPSPPQI